MDPRKGKSVVKGNRSTRPTLSTVGYRLQEAFDLFYGTKKSEDMRDTGTDSSRRYVGALYNRAATPDTSDDIQLLSGRADYYDKSRQQYKAPAV
ncbi:hypothetical protein [Cohnella mopanensis]|uniref:hypothetical protein n=1 Tax=Cohnella mopanensis TaxID=2911966 RepID=UPI001EF84FB1|nr:hypothetical protein [Cohnella mopanensis]